MDCPMIVRPFKKSDARDCTDVITACVTSMKHLDGPARFYMLSKNDPADFFNEIKEDYALVAELHGQVVGVGALHENEIHRVYVSPDYQGNGIGETLILELEAEAEARGITRLQLQTPVASTDFYEHLGYTNEGKGYAKIGYATFEVVNMTKEISRPAGV